MQPLEYVVLQHAVRLDRPVQACARWMERIPLADREALQLDGKPHVARTPSEDALCMATLKHYRRLMPLAQEARKPMFLLAPADGAIGGHMAAVLAYERDFTNLAWRILRSTGEAPPRTTTTGTEGL